MNECPHGLFDVCCTNYDNCAIGEPKKEWVGLTEDEVADFALFHAVVDEECVRAIEVKLKEKNT
jgi:nitrogen regulatory protein PII-like uncharacterized protein